MRIVAVSGVCDPRCLVPGAVPSGTEAHLYGSVHGLATAGHEVVVHGPDRGHLDPAATGELVLDPAPTGDIDVDDATDAHAAAAGIDRFAAGLASRWRSNPPELVHAHDWFAGAAARRALHAVRGDIGRIPLVVTLPALGHVHRRHLGATPYSSPLRLAVESDLARSADLLLATCIDQHRELLGLGAHRDRTVTVPEGVDGARFTTPRARRPKASVPVLTVSDLAPHRDTESVIAAVARVPDATLTIVGGPPASRLATDARVAELRALAARHDAIDRVRFTGRVPHAEMPALFGAADVVVQVPWFTGFGRAAVEALACGRPVIASAVGGQLETVEHGVNGVIVPARDPHALHDALRKLVTDGRCRAVLGHAARPRTLDRFGWPRVTEATIDAYDRARRAAEVADLAEQAPVEVAG
ncbi:MAG: glycosyltransferase [Nitriliruptor sp.]|uniref:glycosyltransferase n=1 Tax=Nitriliruptor sp. TaxID=2448056 RepID=UPI0034A05635